MKRDADLIRSILLYIEQGDPHPLEGLAVHDCHVGLCVQAGYLTDEGDLSWAGVNFLELARDNWDWLEAIRDVVQELGGVNFERVEEILEERRERRLLGLG